MAEIHRTPSSAVQSALGAYACRVRVVRYDTVDSTNNQAKLHAAEADSPALYIARTQTGGRGRLGRSFHSPAHTGLYMTVAYTTNEPLGEAVRVTAGAAVAAASAIEELTGLQLAIKWVNDLYLKGCKVGGILTEAVTLEGGRTRMVVGIGINLTTTEFPDGLRAPASCLFTGEDAETVPPDLSDRLAGEITRRLLGLVEASADCPWDGGLKGEACLDFYRSRLLYVGEEVICTRGEDTFTGVVEGVDEGYSLLLRVQGQTRVLSSGEISVRPVSKS